MGYYLLDNRNPHGEHFYTKRLAKLRVIVLHITAGLEDIDLIGRDVSAERTAAYAASTTRQVSWHAGADSDSHFYLLPATYTAWHASNYNSISWGVEISKTDTTWRDEPAKWIAATLRHAAMACAPIVRAYRIPLKRLTRAQVDAGMSGFVYHSDLDPARRSDPGKDFPITEFFTAVRKELAPKGWDEMATEAELKRVVRDVVREELADLNINNLVSGKDSNFPVLLSWMHKHIVDIKRMLEKEDTE